MSTAASAYLSRVITPVWLTWCKNSLQWASLQCGIREGSDKTQLRTEGFSLFRVTQQGVTPRFSQSTSFRRKTTNNVDWLRPSAGSKPRLKWHERAWYPTRKLGPRPRSHAPNCCRERSEHERDRVDLEWHARCKARWWHEYRRLARHASEPSVPATSHWATPDTMKEKGPELAARRVSAGSSVHFQY